MPKNLLLAVAGYTSATITEALWALAVRNKIPLDEVRILTTHSAHQRIAGEFAEALALLRSDYPKATLPQRATWRIAQLSDGCELDDIRSSKDNEALADWIMQETRIVCSVEGQVVHASLAGGRKTMSFYLGAALQLCARPGDKLYHVLVPSEFEVPGFFFPRAKSSKKTLLTLRSGETLDAATATVELAEVPFVRLQPLLKGGEATHLTFRQMVSRADDSLSDEYASVRVSVPSAGTSGKATIEFHLPGKHSVFLEYKSPATAEFLFYTWLLFRAKQSLPPVQLTDRSRFQETIDNYITWAQLLRLPSESLDELKKMEIEFNDNRRNQELKGTSDLEGFLRGWYEQHKVYPPRIKKKLADEFAKQAPGFDPEKYAIKLQGKEGMTLQIPPENIQLPGSVAKRNK